MRCTQQPPRIRQTIGLDRVRRIAARRGVCARRDDFGDIELRAEPDSRPRHRRQRRRRPRSRFRPRPITTSRPATAHSISAATSWSALATRPLAASIARCGPIPAAAGPRRPPRIRVTAPGTRATAFRSGPIRRAISSAISARPLAASPASVRGSRRASISASPSTRAIPTSTFRWHCSRRRSI